MLFNKAYETNEKLPMQIVSFYLFIQICITKIITNAWNEIPLKQNIIFYVLNGWIHVEPLNNLLIFINSRFGIKHILPSLLLSQIDSFLHTYYTLRKNHTIWPNTPRMPIS